MSPLIAFLEEALRHLAVAPGLRPIAAFLVIVAFVAGALFVIMGLLVRRRAISRNTAAFWLFVSPWLFGFLAFTLGPMAYSLVLSFMHWDLTTPATFAGISNYQKALSDPLFGQAVKVTLIYAVVSVPLQTALSLAVALLMNTKAPGIHIFRTIWYLPSLVTGVAQITLFLWVFNSDYGLVNGVLGTVGIKGPPWFQDPNWALPAVILMSLWTVGGNMVIYLAGLQDVPADLYEASALDGAGRLRQLWNITIPQMSPVIFFNAVTGLIAAMQVFTQAFVVQQQGGAPSNSLLFIVFYLYQNAFQYFQMGYASALAWLFLLMILALTALVFRGSSFWVYYESANPRASRKERRRLRVS